MRGVAGNLAVHSVSERLVAALSCAAGLQAAALRAKKSSGFGIQPWACVVGVTGHAVCFL